MSERCSAVLAAVHDTIGNELERMKGTDRRPLSLLDVGCWDGEATARYRHRLGGPARGIEIFPGPAAAARARGIEVAEVDLETQRFPWSNESVDVVIANQVFEHLKNVWLPLSEIARLLVPGGRLVFSVPNLASVHNRVLLAVGRQPTSIRTFGPHVRGYTLRQVIDFLTLDRFLAVERIVGVGFYPFPVALAKPLARLWASGSHTPVVVVRRIAPSGTRPPWAAHFADAQAAGEQTFYA